MAKRRKAKRKVARRAAARSSRSRPSSDNSSGVWIALVIAVVAVVGLVLLYNETGASGGAVVTGITTQGPGGLSEEGQIGWELGAQVAQRYDGSEVREYCSLGCGAVCARTISPAGTDQRRCFKLCQDRCTKEVNVAAFGEDRRY